MTRKDYVAIAKVFYDAREWAYKEWGKNDYFGGDTTDYHTAATRAIDEIENRRWYSKIMLVVITD